MTQEEQIQKSLDEITKQTADLMGRVQTEGVTHGGQFIIPPTKQYTPDLSQVDGAIAREKEYTALLESKQSEYEQLAKQREEELKQAETEQKSVLDRMKDLVGMAKPAEVREERLTDLGYDSAKFLAEQRADISEMEALRIDYDKAVAMRDQQIADIHGTAGIGMDFLNNAIAQINRNANVVLSQKASAINNKAAIMEMKQGNFNQAISLADQAVEDFLYEIKFEYDMYYMFNQQNEDRINYLRGELKESLQTAEQYALAQYEEAKEEQTQVKNLMLQYPNSGIKIGDTLDEATQKASQWAGAQPEPGEIREVSGVGVVKIKADGTYEVIVPEGDTPTQYTKEWEEAGGLEGTGMTKSDWIKHRTGISEVAPRVWNDDEIRAKLKDVATYQEALENIAIATTLQNKERAREIAAEIYGITPETPSVKPGIIKPEAEGREAGWGLIWTEEGGLIPQEDYQLYLERKKKEESGVGTTKPTKPTGPLDRVDIVPLYNW
ncbi:MAG: hypothetical protein PHV11_06260 [Candidatus Bipolaricaulis sp.]|nr:hypothetical protein [Candidatus Bipolaricaulis sp.]